MTLLIGTWSAFCSACGQLGACCLLPSFRLYSKFTSIPSLCLPWGSYWIIWKLQNFWAPELHGMSGLYFSALPVLVLDLCSGMYKGSWLVSTLNLHILSLECNFLEGKHFQKMSTWEKRFPKGDMEIFRENNFFVVHLCELSWVIIDEVSNIWSISKNILSF